MTLRARHLNPQITFVLLAVLVNVLASGAVAHITDPARHRMAEWAATLDMTLTVTGLYYWLVVRPGLRPWNSLVFIAMMGLLRATTAFPTAFPAVVPGKLFPVGCKLGHHRLHLIPRSELYILRDPIFSDPSFRDPSFRDPSLRDRWESKPDPL